MNKRKGTALILLGSLLLLAALGWLVYNMQTELTAGRSSRQALSVLSGLRGQAGQAAVGVLDAPQGSAQPAAGAGETPAPQADAAGAPTLQPEPVPDYIRFPQMEMPIVEVEGHGYIGTLCIPDLGLELPVMSEWSYPKLKIAPCRFTGSAYQDDLIIVAHNYVTHLRNIKTLPAGAEVTFTDMAGNVFCYALAEIEILKPDQVEELMGTDYPLTLVTCTIGGETRVTARCVKTGEIPAVGGRGIFP